MSTHIIHENGVKVAMVKLTLAMALGLVGQSLFCAAPGYAAVSTPFTVTGGGGGTGGTGCQDADAHAAAGVPWSCDGSMSEDFDKETAFDPAGKFADATACAAYGGPNQSPVPFNCLALNPGNATDPYSSVCTYNYTGATFDSAGVHMGEHLTSGTYGNMYYPGTGSPGHGTFNVGGYIFAGGTYAGGDYYIEYKRRNNAPGYPDAGDIKTGDTDAWNIGDGAGAWPGGIPPGSPPGTQDVPASSVTIINYNFPEFGQWSYNYYLPNNGPEINVGNFGYNFKSLWDGNFHTVGFKKQSGNLYLYFDGGLVASTPVLYSQWNQAGFNGPHFGFGSIGDHCPNNELDATTAYAHVYHP